MIGGREADSNARHNILVENEANQSIFSLGCCTDSQFLEVIYQFDIEILEKD